MSQPEILRAAPFRSLVGCYGNAASWGRNATDQNVVIGRENGQAHEGEIAIAHYPGNPRSRGVFDGVVHLLPNGINGRAGSCNRRHNCGYLNNHLVGPSFVVSSARTHDSTDLEPAAQHPWRPDPNDNRTPICPPDTISVNRAASRRPVVVAIKRRFLDFFVQPHEHHAQQIVGHVLTVRHALADCAGLFKQGFGFGLFHSSTVGRLAVK